MRKIVKNTGYAVLAILIIIIAWQHEMIGYGISQGYGQFKVLYNAEPVEKAMQDKSLPDSLKQRLLLIQEIRKYAVDSLGLNDSKSYTTLYNQHGKAILWNVTASEPFALKAKEWTFPFLGTFSYKGFFDLKKAQKEEQVLRKEGYDTDIGVISGWSTLGWFKDPILSNMLYRKEGNLAELIIHELTHATLYVKDSVQYNENLAQFIGTKGAIQFLTDKYGVDSPEYRDYVNTNNDEKLYSRYILKSARQLDSLYKTFKPGISTAEKRTLKQALIRDVSYKIAYVPFRNKRRYVRRIFLSEPNNTYFMDYIRYEEKQNVFEKQFEEKFNSDFKEFLAYLKSKYSSL